jgi:beta-mannosidase
MIRIFFLWIISFAAITNVVAQSAPIKISLNKGWKFKRSTDSLWLHAFVPGTVHTDLLANKLIPDPFYRDNENKLQWIAETNWDYKLIFNLASKYFSKKHIQLVFEGLDTYAVVYLNGKLIVSADNMFRTWKADIRSIAQRENNELVIHFYSPLRKQAEKAAAATIQLPTDDRVYTRKAPYSFGWDWGPKLITSGIWRPVYIKAFNVEETPPKKIISSVKLIQQKDQYGQSFYFTKNGKPIFIKGANWIPAHSFLPSAKYRELIIAAKDAGINMLRVWGGGIYEADEFYSICDELGIMVWQDLMFACAMYPGDNDFIQNVKNEIRDNVMRLRSHPCIVLWCGNNEVEEAWHNWGWQKQMNYSKQDSSTVWSWYIKLFHDSIPVWLKEMDGTRPYYPSSPMHGWGRKESFQEGDSHYWGIWWGLQDIEIFQNKTGRFVSEYGMQAMPTMQTINAFTDTADRYLFSDVLRSHQKHPTGYENLQYYLHRYFIDSTKIRSLSLSEYVYLTNCLQYYSLRNSIAIHRSQPQCMGTMFWQLNDCWPVASWSVIDFFGHFKGGYYAAKQAYRDDIRIEPDKIFPRDLQLKKPKIKLRLEGNKLFVSADVFAKYVFVQVNDAAVKLSDNYFDLQPRETKTIKLNSYKSSITLKDISVMSLYDVLNH